MKKWLEPLSGAWTGVVTHKLRSSLTVLGVVIGVAAVITLMSIGKGRVCSQSWFQGHLPNNGGE